MNDRQQRILFACLPFLLVGSLQCTHLTGGGSEGEGKAIVARGKVCFAETGLPAENAAIFIRKKDFVRPIERGYDTAKPDVSTGEDGRFVIDSIDTGEYFVEVNYRDSLASCIRLAIDGSDPFIELPSVTLRPKSGLQGVAVFKGANAERAYVQVSGLDHLAMVDPLSGEFHFNDLPDGEFNLIIRTTNPPYHPAFLTVVLSPSRITDLDTVLLWPYGSNSMLIYFNTTATGAPLPAGSLVFDFPVLIRLNQLNFPFNEVDALGNGLYFAMGDYSPLPFEIERWDSANTVAEVWVRVDTIFGNTSTHFIRMFWGGQARNNAEKVFDTSLGFQGVWHLADTAIGTLTDATTNSYRGAASGMTQSSIVEGIIGRARKFDGISSYIDVPGSAQGKLSFLTSGNWTVAAWVRADSTPNASQALVSKGLCQYSFMIDSTGKSQFAFTFPSRLRSTSTGTSASAGLWKYIVFTRNGLHESLYEDGIIVSSKGVNVTYSVPYSQEYSVSFGRDPMTSNSLFNGALDEIQMSNVARADTWVKLSYMNQSGIFPLLFFR